MVRKSGKVDHVSPFDSIIYETIQSEMKGRKFYLNILRSVAKMGKFSILTITLLALDFYEAIVAEAELCSIS